MNQESKKPIVIIFSLSAIILAFLFWWIYSKPKGSYVGEWVSYLPYLNCFFNALTASLLVVGYQAIKKGEKKKHIQFMLSAVGCSALFLVSYLTYHHFQGDTKFLGQGIVRLIYFFILISHIVLSIVQIPGILLTLWFAFTNNLKAHKKCAKITFPIWLYVSVTGVLVFVFLKAFNP